MPILDGRLVANTLLENLKIRIQTLHSNKIESGSGSVSQIKASATELIHYAKKMNVPVILVGHITKDGAIAGPKILEHMVDTVLHFEGDRNYIFRILRAKKIVTVRRLKLEYMR